MIWGTQDLSVPLKLQKSNQVHVHCMDDTIQPSHPLMSSSIQFSLVIQSCLTLCNPMECSIPGFPDHHHLPEITQTHVHCISDAIQQSHPLSSPSAPAFNISQHQGLFWWVGSLHQMAKVFNQEKKFISLWTRTFVSVVIPFEKYLNRSRELGSAFPCGFQSRLLLYSPSFRLSIFSF